MGKVTLVQLTVMRQRVMRYTRSRMQKLPKRYVIDLDKRNREFLAKL